MAQAPGREANSLRLARPVNSWRQMADGVGFEPTRPLRVYGISSAAPSTELGDPSAVHSANNDESPGSGDARFSDTSVPCARSTVRPVRTQFCQQRSLA